jgi:hypothetical protein
MRDASHVPSHVPRGRLHLRVERGGRIVAERRARNLVLTGGAEIVARLFAGRPDAGPVNKLRVGFGQEAVDVDATGLTAPPADAGIDPSALEATVAADDFTLETDTAARLVRVSIATTFSPSEDLDGVTEAGLLAGETLYNQVVFEPVDLRVGQDITFFWQVDFPFGR